MDIILPSPFKRLLFFFENERLSCIAIFKETTSPRLFQQLLLKMHKIEHNFIFIIMIDR